MTCRQHFYNKHDTQLSQKHDVRPYANLVNHFVFEDSLFVQNFHGYAFSSFCVLSEFDFGECPFSNCTPHFIFSYLPYHHDSERRTDRASYRTSRNSKQPFLTLQFRRPSPKIRVQARIPSSHSGTVQRLQRFHELTTVPNDNRHLSHFLACVLQRHLAASEIIPSQHRHFSIAAAMRDRQADHCSHTINHVLSVCPGGKSLQIVSVDFRRGLKLRFRKILAPQRRRSF